jgi:tRNA-specific 2-thiouridylase
MSNQRPLVAVAMSGGVDSAVAAALLGEQGHPVVGLMLRLWSGGEDGDNRCCTPESMALAKRVAVKLGFPFHVVDAREPFHKAVVEPFIDGYAQGITPNPCLECNRQIRFDFLLRWALSLGAAFLATGHYARVMHSQAGYSLLRGIDRDKDQSYVLSVLGQEQLAHALFPLGDLTKPAVRVLARKFELPVADRRESQDLCFTGNRDYRAFLRKHTQALSKRGPILDTQGTLLGQHAGLANYTIGQRKGLGLSSPEPLYVAAKNPADNSLTVGPRSALERMAFRVSGLHWVSGETPPGPVRVSIRVRYKAKEVWGTVSPGPSNAGAIELEESLPDITPGQAAVFYNGEVCLGHGVISA